MIDGYLRKEPTMSAVMTIDAITPAATVIIDSAGPAGPPGPEGPQGPPGTGGGIPPGVMGANSILKADAADTPIGLTVPANTFVGRDATSTVTAMTPTTARVVLGLGALAYQNVVNSATIQDSSIANVDISPTAAIALSKLAVDPLARANHTGTQLAATISDFDTQVRTNPLNLLAAPTGPVPGFTPSIGTDLATKAYVDSAAGGGGISASLYDANTILKADVDNTPLALTVGASTFVGRAAAGSIAALTATQAKAILAIVPADVAGFDVQVRASRLDQMAIPTAAVNLNSQKIINLATPTLPTDAVTKAYADGLVTGGLTGTTTAAKTFLGSGAGSAVTTGTDNTFIGLNAGNTITTSSGHTMVGSGAGGTLGATSVGVTAVGYQAAQTVTGDRGTAVGYQAGKGTANTDWVAVGYLATVGGGCTAVGASTTANAGWGTALGWKASATGAGSVAIGVDNAGTGASTAATNEIMLGTTLHTTKTAALWITNGGHIGVGLAGAGPPSPNAYVQAGSTSGFGINSSSTGFGFHTAAVQQGTGGCTGVYSNPTTTTAGAVGTLTAFEGQIRLTSATGATTNGYGAYLRTPNLAAGATMTNAYGVWIDPQKTTGITNGYGIYQASTADINVFGGPVQVGSITQINTSGFTVGAVGDRVGFFAAAPALKPTGTPAAATDPATTQALANFLRSALITLGLIG